MIGPSAIRLPDRSRGGTIVTTELGAVPTALLALKDLLVVADGDGRLNRVGWDGRPAGPPVTVHDGAVLAAAALPDGTAVVSGGDDGRLILTLMADGAPRLLFSAGSKWVDQVAVSGTGRIAWAAGRRAGVLDPAAAGTGPVFDLEWTAGGLAWDPKGRRIAVSHYGGVSLFWTAAEPGPPKRLTWAGSHLATEWSPDGRFLITALQETGLHGWRLSDGADLRMTGYPVKTKCLSWSAKGAWLATSGADAAVCWPFRGKDGPMGKRPLETGRRDNRLVTQCAFDPVRDRLALGYQDGMVLVVSLDGADLVTFAFPSSDPVAFLAWSPDGRRLAWAGESGAAAIGTI